MTQRPSFEAIKNGAEFNQWYWLKEEMVGICKAIGLPSIGSKFEIRDRIIFALDNQGMVQKIDTNLKKTSKFNWAKEVLKAETIITDSVSFGPNFRKFMTQEIGNQFVCHSDFMDWVKANIGKTLSDAMQEWFEMEKRKTNLGFKREIREHNMLAQYIRDFTAENANFTVKEIHKIWFKKRRLPMKDGFVKYGFVKYDKSDLNL
jgi:Domain of unknown function (DUF6434)/SAP domain-containing new25